jgi:hypothetical protein
LRVICAEELLELFLGFFLRDAVTLLQLANQLLASPFDDLEVIVGQFSPLFLDLAFELPPVSADSIFIHDFVSFSVFTITIRTSQTIGQTPVPH